MSVLKKLPEDSSLLKHGVISNFVTRVESMHGEVLQQMKIAAHQVIYGMSGIAALPFSDEEVLVRVMNYRTLAIRDLKSNYIGKFVSVKGNVVRVGPVRPLIVRATFVCQQCGARIVVNFREGRYSLPEKCRTEGCKCRTFIPDRRAIDAVDWQKIRIQEIITDFKDSGRIPQTIECELTEELVGTCVPGDVVCVSGVVRIVSSEGDWVNTMGSSRERELQRESIVNGIGRGGGGIGNEGGEEVGERRSEGGGGVGGRSWRGRRRGGGYGQTINIRKPPTLFVIFIYANNITTSRDGLAMSDNFVPASTEGMRMSMYGGGGNGVIQSSLNNTPFSSRRDCALIRKIVLRENLFEFLVASLAPNIYGHYIIKKGFVLALFGGTEESSSMRGYVGMNGMGKKAGNDFDGGGRRNEEKKGGSEVVRNREGDGEGGRMWDKMGIRSSIHMLIVGDPGMGKSQMLRAVASITPRGVYVGGNTSTSSGLTVTVVKEGGDFALEAGALILGDRGTCCIDEFDKMGRDHEALLEAMEQQSISIAKGGMVCSLSARTSILAAANPSGGHYDRSKTVSENLKLSPMILSRFDLVFVMMDKPDANVDKQLSEHLVRMHAHRAATREEMERKRQEDDELWTNGKMEVDLNEKMEMEGENRRDGERGRYCERGSVFGEEVSADYISQYSEGITRKGYTDPLPVQHFRRYIAYARAHCFPRLSSGAMYKLREYFLELRRMHHSSDAAVVTARQLESLVRLGEARARAELREEVTEGDAEEVIDIMRQSLYDNLANETGLVEISRASGMSRSKDSSRLARALHEVTKQTGKSTLSVREIVEVGRQIGIVSGVSRLIESMNQHGILLKKPNQCYKLSGGDYED